MMTRCPAHPGEMLKGLYMEPLNLSIPELANKLGISINSLTNFVDGNCPVSVDLAMRLARAFDTTPELWLNAQRNLDVWEARQGNPPWQNVKPIYKHEVPIEVV